MICTAAGLKLIMLPDRVGLSAVCTYPFDHIKYVKSCRLSL